MHEIYNTGSKRALEIKLDLCYAPHPPRIRVQETGYGVGDSLHIELEEGGIVGRRELKADAAIDHR